MNIKSFLNLCKNKRTQNKLIISTVLCLVLFLSPIPHEMFTQGVNLMILFYWIILFLYIWSIWFQDSLKNLFYFLSLLFSFIISLVAAQWYVFFSILFLGLWSYKRASRLKISSVLLLSVSLNSFAQFDEDSNKQEFLDGYHLRNVISCSAIDKIPWQLRSDGRKVRLILKDKLKFSNDSQAFVWELFQIINPQGLVTYVFKKVRENAKGKVGHEYIAVRGDKMERIIQSDKSSTSSIVPVESHNLKQLINRTAFTFYHEDGSVLEYVPGPTERSTVIIKPMHQGGYTLSPIYLTGLGCDRPESLSEDDVKGDALGTKRSEKQANPAAK